MPQQIPIHKRNERLSLVWINLSRLSRPNRLDRPAQSLEPVKREAGTSLHAPAASAVT